MPTAIETKNLCKIFRSGLLRKEKKSLSDLNLQVDSGKIFGFLGPNGAGKTTTLKLLTSLIRPTSGDVRIFGRAPCEPSVKKRIGFLPERPYFYDYLSGVEFLDFCGALFGMGAADRTKKIEALFELVQLKGVGGLPLRSYSKGMLQRIGLAQALINDPDLVILDEPMSGLDPIGRKDVRDIILKLKALGKTVFFSTHVLSDAEMICDQVGILIQGKLKKLGNLEAMLDRKLKSVEISFEGIPEEALSAFRPALKAIATDRKVHLVTLRDAALLDQLMRWIPRQGGRVLSVIPRKESLEDLFMEEIRESKP